MGMRTEIQAEMAEAFNAKDELFDAVSTFTCKRSIKSNWNPVTETFNEDHVEYSGRGVLGNYAKDTVKPTDYEATDGKLLVLQNEVTEMPILGDVLIFALGNFKVLDISQDPANVIWTIQIREV